MIIGIVHLELPNIRENVNGDQDRMSWKQCNISQLHTARLCMGLAKCDFHSRGGISFLRLICICSVVIKRNPLYQNKFLDLPTSVVRSYARV